ncbi:hypothetical protein RAM19_04250 [Bartonella apihabitans]|nr:hypothetical protein [Bartonella apihabitans]WLT09382.1 hypothetical protein RAM19_04250 [Bartonella apihabitans]
MFNYSSQHTGIFIFSDFPKDRAIAISKFLKNATIYGTSRVEGSDITIVDDIANSIKEAFLSGRPIIAFCASGILIRILAPLLKDKFSEPPVLCITEDGSSVVPLLGANIGANDLASDLAKLLDSHAAITTSGYLRFGLNLLTPPEDLELVNKKDAASFLSSLLAGETVELVGTHQWFSTGSLPFATDASLKIVIDENGSDIKGSSTKLIYRKSKKNGLLTIVGLTRKQRKYYLFCS